MAMIHTIKPYGCVNADVVNKISTKGDKYYLIDDYGWWEIEQKDYERLERAGVEKYERTSGTTNLMG